MICVSVVSHGHGQMVARLVQSLLACPEVGQVLLTLNTPESLDLDSDERLQVLWNDTPKGFGANHNFAFTLCRQDFFCVLNPDISFLGSPFPPLLAAMSDAELSMVAPFVYSPEGKIEDSFRRFPTLTRLFAKALGGRVDLYVLGDGKGVFLPDWVAGMFMLFRRGVFEALEGFDENYFLYYEDVDICVRCWKNGQQVAVCSDVSVTHDAQRASHHSARHMRWHASSMALFFFKHWLRLPVVKNIWLEWKV